MQDDYIRSGACARVGEVVSRSKRGGWSQGVKRWYSPDIIPKKKVAPNPHKDIMPFTEAYIARRRSMATTICVSQEA